MSLLIAAMYALCLRVLGREGGKDGWMEGRKGGIGEGQREVGRVDGWKEGRKGEKGVIYLVL